MSKRNYTEAAKRLIESVGYEQNVSLFTHCVTRLRFNIKDKGLVDSEMASSVDGVLGTQWSGNQFQVVIGANVDSFYTAVCEEGGFDEQARINENLDPGITKRFDLRKIGHSIIAYISSTMNGVIIMMMAACMCKTIQTILSPSMMNLISMDGDAYLTLQFIYSAFFYFLPIFLGYSSARAVNINPTYGIFLGALIIVPDFTSLIGTRDTVTVLGMQAPVTSYAQTFLPVVLGVWIMSLVYRFFKKIIPDIISMIFVPTLTILVMLPIMFLVCAPFGTYLGNIIGNFFVAMSQSHLAIKIIAAVALASLFPYLVLSGMHGALTTFAITALLTTGSESYLLPIMTGYNFAVFGVALGAAIRTRDKKDRASFVAFFISGILGSITEPILYGIVLKYRNAMKMLMIACALTGLYVGLFAPVYYTLSGATILTITVPWTAEGVTMSNVINGTSMLLFGLIAGAICGYFIDYTHTINKY